MFNYYINEKKIKGKNEDEKKKIKEKMEEIKRKSKKIYNINFNNNRKNEKINKKL